MGRVRMIGYDPEGRMVYDALMDTGDYYDGQHPWDSDVEVRRLRLARVIGEIRDWDGTVSEQWETHFDPDTGEFLHGVSHTGDETRVLSADDANYGGTIVPVQTPDADTTQQALLL